AARSGGGPRGLVPARRPGPWGTAAGRKPVDRLCGTGFRGSARDPPPFAKPRHRAGRRLYGGCLAALALAADDAARPRRFRPRPAGARRPGARAPLALRPTPFANEMPPRNHRSDLKRPAMEVNLLEGVGRLGHMGDIVRVKDGFARNFLLPKGKALRATKENKAKYEGMKAVLEVRNVEMRGEAQKVGGGLDGKSFVVLRQASEAGQLYGSVSGRDLALILNEAGFTAVTRSQIALNAPIKNIGLHKGPVALHPEVEGTVTIKVARRAGGARRAARGAGAGEVTGGRGEGEEGGAGDTGPFFEQREQAGEEAEAGAPPAAPASEEGDGDAKPAKPARKTKAAEEAPAEAKETKPARKPRKARGADE